MIRRTALLICFALCLGPSAEAGSARRDPTEAKPAAQDSPLPPPRSEALGASDRGEPAQVETTAAIPLPPPRPSDAPSLATPASVVADQDGETAFQGCLDRLATLGAQAEPLPPIHAGACGAARPVRLLRLPGGLAVSTAAVVTCPMAEALAQWSKEVIETESRRAFQTAPLAVQIGTSYQCRGQNRQAFAKLSEHAYANAVDVMGFTFPKRAPIPVTFHPEGSPEGAFFQAVRAGACRHFTTVLGPGSDAYHADHLHIDLRGRRGTARLCQ